MFWLIIGWALKVIGGVSVIVKIINIFVSWPRNLQQFNEWKAKKSCDLFILAREYRMTGRKPKFKWYQKKLYKLARMPCPHIWQWDDLEPHEEKRNWYHHIRVRFWSRNEPVQKRSSQIT